MARLQKFQELVGDILTNREVGSPWYIYDDDPDIVTEGLALAWYVNEEIDPNSDENELMYQMLIPENELNRAGYFRKEVDNA